MNNPGNEHLSQTVNSFSDISATSEPRDNRDYQKLKHEKKPQQEQRQSDNSASSKGSQSHIKGGAENNTSTERVFILLSYIFAIITFPFSLIVCLTTANVYERIVVLRLGRILGIKGPGLVFTLPCVDNIFRVDLRTQSFDVEPQEVLTKDSVTISVDAVVYFKIFKPMDAVCQVYNVREATQLLAQTTLRNVLGMKNLAEVLTSKDAISKTLGQILDEATDPWGVKVERVEIKNIELPVNMQRAMAKEQQAVREAEAKVVAAKGELVASENLRLASDVIKTSPIAMQLRYLQTINAISNKKSHTIIVPYPQALIKKYLHRK